jgi:hypothetical protein
MTKPTYDIWVSDLRCPLQENNPVTFEYQSAPADGIYNASHSKVAPENVGLQKEKKYNTFACHTCNEVRLCVLGIHISWQHEKIR